jgi:hypothetical protein
MKVTCPTCREPIAAADIALDKGWAKCMRCNEVFALADRLPGYAAAVAKKDRPFDAWAIVERDARRLTVHLPAQGMRAGTFAGLGFAIVWTGFIAFWTAGALGVFFNKGPLKLENALFAAFSTPFWLIGFGMFGGVIWMARGTRSVLVDASKLVTELRCLMWRRTRRLSRDQVQCARVGTIQTIQKQGSLPTPSVEIIFTKGSFKLPCASEAEQQWLIAEINDFLQAVPSDPTIRGTLAGDSALFER